MCACIVDIDYIAYINLRKHTVNCELVAVFAKTACYIVFVVAGLIFLAHNRNMMICAVDGRTHKVSGTSVKTDILLVDMLFTDSLSNKRTVGCKHISAKLCEDSYIAHTCGNEYFFVSLADALTDNLYIVCGLVRLIRNAYTTGQIDEA